jgi:phosphoenolpyruvate synthase/pyruvate phosphate dikinase
MKSRRLLLAIPSAAALILGFAACGNVDTGKIESEIKKQVEEQAKGQVQVKSVKCPDDVKAKKGDKFTCTITAENGATAKALVVQQDDNGNVRFTANLLPLLAGPNQ